MAVPQLVSEVAIVLVFFNPLDHNDRCVYDLQPGTTFFDWLKEEYPEGFGRPITIIVNGEPIELTEMDFEVNAGDVISVVVNPAGPALAPILVASLITAIATIAASVIVYLVFGKPRKPKDQPNPDPVYSLQGGSNMVRLGEPIPVPYGRIITYPDAATSPYAFFHQNNQYIDQILCLGHGEYEIEGIMVAETPGDTLAPGVVTWQQWGPADHGQVMGTIEAATGIMEDVVTSLEVADQELTGFPMGDIVQQVEHLWFDGPDRLEYINFPPPAGYTLFTITGSNKNDGYYTMQSYNPGGGPGTETSAITTVEKTIQSATPDQNITLTWYKSASQLTVGPFATNPPGTTGNRIMLDMFWPQGLYRINADNGGLENLSVSFTVTYQQIDNDGNDIGAPVDNDYVFTAATNTPQRMTYHIPVASGRYKVSVTRHTPAPTNARQVNNFAWVGLKMKLDNKATPVYGSTTLISVRIKATNGLASDAANKIRVIATRKLPRHGSGLPLPTRSPVDAYIDACTNTIYGLGRPLSVIDVAGLVALETHWTPAYALFDGIFNQKTTVWEALAVILQPVAAVPVRTGKFLSAASDGRKIAPVQLFSDANMIEDTFQASYEFDRPGEYQGVQVEYRDPVTFQPAHVQYPLTAVDLETVVLFGCTTKIIAEQYARLLWQRKLHLRQFSVFETELEGFIPVVSSRVLVSTNAVAWGESGEVISSPAANVLLLDRTVDLTQYTSPFIVVRDPSGKPSNKIPITAGAVPRQVVLSSALPFAIQPMLGDERASEWAVGDLQRRVKDFTVQNVEHVGENSTRVSLVIYDERVWDNTLAFLSVPI